MFTSILQQIFIQHKQKLLFGGVCATLLFLGVDSVFASTAEEKLDGIIQGINFLLTIVSTLLGVLTGLISLFLNPGWVNGTIFGLDVYLKDIWILISNIVYFIFAFVLIVIAFMNIIGRGQDKWQLKTALPKFAIGVLIVPFSWLFVQFVLSVSAILTVSVLSLPFDTLDGRDEFKNVGTKEICDTYQMDLSAKTATATTTPPVKLTGAAHCASIGGSMMPISDVLSGKGVNGTAGAVYGILNIYTYGILKVEEITTLRKEHIATDAVKTLADLSIKIIFDLIFIIVYALLMVALFMALFARGTWLWIHAMFSPVYGLMFFFGKDSGGEEAKKLSVTEFISLALVPVYVSAALSFGLIFIFVAAHGLTTSAKNTDGIFTMVGTDGKTPVYPDNKGNYVTGATPVLKVGGFKLKVKGEHGSKVAGDINDIVGSFGGGLGQLILELFGLAILWIALMAALKQSDITNNVVAPIRSFGESVGSLIAKSPMYAPIIPGPSGQMMSTSALQNFGSSTVSSINQAAAKPGGDLASQFFQQSSTQKAINNLRTSAIDLSSEATGENQMRADLLPVLRLLDNEKTDPQEYKKAMEQINMQGGFKTPEAYQKMLGLHGTRGEKPFYEAMRESLDTNIIKKLNFRRPDDLRNEMKVDGSVRDKDVTAPVAPVNVSNKYDFTNMGKVPGTTGSYRVGKNDKGVDVNIEANQFSKAGVLDENLLSNTLKKLGVTEEDSKKVYEKMKKDFGSDDVLGNPDGIDVGD